MSWANLLSRNFIHLYGFIIPGQNAIFQIYFYFLVGDAASFQKICFGNFVRFLSLFIGPIKFGLKTRFRVNHRFNMKNHKIKVAPKTARQKNLKFFPRQVCAKTRQYVPVNKPLCYHVPKCVDIETDWRIG